jgi:transcriptional regulator with XRE-family HTH domain
VKFFTCPKKEDHVTPFGKEIRKLRNEAEPRIFMSKMAKDLGKLPSYLSDVELGEKPLSEEFAKAIIAYLKNHSALKNKRVDADYLQALADRSRRTVNVEALKESERETLVAFARRLPNLPATKRAKLNEKFEEWLNDSNE